MIINTDTHPTQTRVWDKQKAEIESRLDLSNNDHLGKQINFCGASTLHCLLEFPFHVKLPTSLETCGQYQNVQCNKN